MFNKRVKFIKDQQVADVFESYPEPIRKELLFLRQLILETAAEIENLGKLEETLKWGEPSYLCKLGSTIRINQIVSKLGKYAIYFHCKTTLVETFRELYPDTFTFDANRAIVFNSTQEVPVDALKHCITLALTYHKVKHLPMLGA